MGIEIKPCPFCGEIPFVGPTNPKIEGDAWGYVECRNPVCVISEVQVKDGEDCCDERGTKAYQKAAIKRWNKRHET